MESELEQIKNKDILDVKDVSLLLGVSEATVLRWLKAKKIQGFFRVGRKWLLRKDDFERFISQKIDENQ